MRRRFKQARLLLLAICLCGAPVWPLTAQVIGVDSAEIEAPPVATPVPPEYASPRATMKTFLVNINKVADGKASDVERQKVFDAMDMPAAAGEARTDIALRLLGVFKGLGNINPDTVDTILPSEEVATQENLTEFEFFPNNSRWAATRLFRSALAELGDPPARIVLVKTDSGAWKFSSETLGKINQLIGWIEEGGVDISELSTSAWLRSKMPDFLKNSYFLDIELYQWVGLLSIIFLAVIVDFASRLLLRPAVRQLARRYLGEPDDDSIRFTVRPIGLAVGALVFLFMLNLLGLTGMTLTMLVLAGKVVWIVGITWAAWAVTDLVSNIFVEKAKLTETTFDDMIIPLVRKTLKLFIVALGLIYTANAFDIALAPLLGGLGLAGLAISFAAQDMVKNLFGGVMIFLDRPFKIGERINYQGFDGVIEEIGFRTTRMRTLTGHLVTIPNGSITSDPVENIGRRPYIRRTMNIGITYDTPREKIEQGVEIVRAILEEDDLREPIHGSVGDDEYPPRVYFNDYADMSLNIIVIYWFMPPAYWDYLDHAQRFNLRLFEEFEKAGIEFAFPTQTLYLAGDPKRPLDLGPAAAR